MTHRIALGLIATATLVGAAWPSAGFAQTVETGIRVVVADRLPRWDTDRGGYWTVVAARSASRKFTLRNTTDEAAVPPGTFDLYWIVDADHADTPLLMAEDVVVTAGVLTEVRIQSGLIFDIADWVPPIDPAIGRVTAVQADTMALVNWTTSTAMVLPPGEYGLYWDDDVTDDRQPVWVGTYEVNAPFSGIGLELSAEPLITVVRALPGGGAAAAGMQAGDVIVAVDGTDTTQMSLPDTVALIRGPAGTPVVLTVRREGVTEPLAISVQRSIVEPQNIARIDAGIRLVGDPAMPTLGPGGWWGVAYDGEGPNDLAAIALDADAILLVGHTTYDVYWAPDGDTEPRLVAEGVEADTGILEVALTPVAAAPPPAVAPPKPRTQ